MKAEVLGKNVQTLLGLAPFPVRTLASCILNSPDFLTAKILSDFMRVYL